MASTTGPAQRDAHGHGERRRPLRALWRRLERTDEAGIRLAYYLLILSTAALTCLGMVMVLSSSAVEYVSRNTDPYQLFVKQAIFGAVGLVAMFAIAALPEKTLRKLAWPGLGVGLLLLVLVLLIGKTVLGNKNWIEIGPVTLQPSEFAKFALILWAAHVLAQKAKYQGDWKHAIIPVIFPVGLGALGLVMLGHDLGTAIIIGLILLALLWAAGAPRIIFTTTLIAGVAGAVILAITNGNRLGRITSWLGMGGDDDALGVGMQALQGRYALASGGWFGVGLGQSRLKWSYIPEAQNDFIFSIIGEELGLVGTLGVVALFVIMAVSMYRIAHRSRSLFVRIATAGVLMWLVGQAFINMAMVTGLLPVIGLPLPFISYGGSALLAALMGVGLVLNFARQQIRNGVPDLDRDAAEAHPGKKEA